MTLTTGLHIFGSIVMVGLSSLFSAPLFAQNIYSDQDEAYAICDKYYRDALASPNATVIEACGYHPKVGSHKPHYTCEARLHVDGNIYGCGFFGPDSDLSTSYYWREPVRAEPRKNLGSPRCREQCFGDPINAGTGNKFETRVEYLGAGPFPIRIAWTYNSNELTSYFTASSLIFGKKRANFYSRTLNFIPGLVPMVYLTRPNGRTLRFLKVNSVWVTDSDADGTLIELPDGGPALWTFDNDQGEKESFDPDGKLISLSSSDGYEQALSYDGNGRLQSVSDAYGRSIQFEYNNEGFVSIAHLPDGEMLNFSYTGDQYLSHVEYPGGAGITYLYNEPELISGDVPEGALTGILDESTSRYSSTSYVDQYAVATSLSGGVDSYSASYQEFSDGSYAVQSSITSPAGAVKVVNFSSVRAAVVSTSVTTSCSDCQTSELINEYYSDGRLHTAVINGVVTTYTYDPRGLVTQKVDADYDVTGSKRITETDWNSEWRVPDERRIYDADRVLISNGHWTYNSRGQALTQVLTDPVSGSTRASATTYCEQADIDAGICPLLGLVKSVDGPRTDITDLTTYTYYPSDDASCAAVPTTCPHRKGDLWKVTNALGHVTETLRYDGAGRVLSVKAPTGVVTDVEYHPRGWLTARKVRGANDNSEIDDAITGIDYWPTGLVKQVTQPDGAFTAYTYDDAHRLTDIADNEGNTIHYTLDNAGNRTGEETKDDQGTLFRTLSRVYNQLGQLETQRDAYAHATGYTHDANGNPDMVTDALTRVTDNDYDPLNRLRRTLQDIDGIAAETKFEYDALDNLTKVTDPKGLDTDYTYNGLGDLLQLDSPDTGTTTYTYDSAGNRQTQTDARGITTTYSYDALNRLTTIAYSDGSKGTTYAYDSGSNCDPYTKGRLARMDDASGTTLYCYDRFGNLTRKQQIVNGKTFTVQYAYTLAGQLSSVIYPDGLTVDYVRDDQGRTTEIGVTPSGGARQVLLTEATYYPFGPAAEWVYGNGRLMRRGHNLNYQPGFVEDPSAGGISLGYEFDAVGNLKKLRGADQSDPPDRTYNYDGLNRLTETSDGVSGALLQGYTYDATGNRTSATVGGTTTPYTYPALSHRLTQVDSSNRTYDNAGNTKTIGGTAKTFAYNAANRMSQVTAGILGPTNYVYNGKGEQVRKYRGTNNTYTVYDESGHWLGDYDTSGAPVQQAIWLDDLPVGLVIGTNNQLHYIEPDHLGTPRVVIDPVRDVAVWHWELAGEAFGNSAPNENPDGDANNFVFNMRFPGQRYDAASGLNYNYFRDYESGIGRYVESDPIGLNGGVGTFGYAGGKPTSKIDPKGMFWFASSCDSDQRTFIINQIVQLSNEISASAKNAKKDCKGDGCDWRLAASAMRWIANTAYFKCDRGEACAGLPYINGYPYLELYAPYIGAPDSSKISSQGKCGCFRSALFHEAVHGVDLKMEENDVRRRTLECVSCGTNVQEITGAPL